VEAKERCKSKMQSTLWMKQYNDQVHLFSYLSVYICSLGGLQVNCFFWLLQSTNDMAQKKD
jgi:hypothetical protein